MDKIKQSINGKTGLEIIYETKKEKATWSLVPNMFSKWGTVNAPKNAILTLEVTQLDGINGKLLSSLGRIFTNKDASKLSELNKKYNKE